MAKKKKKKKNQPIPTMLRLPSDVKRKFKVLAAAKETSMNQYISNLILREWRESGIHINKP